MAVPELRLLAFPAAQGAVGALRLGERFLCDEKVRPIIGRGSFLHLAGTSHWVPPAS